MKIECRKCKHSKVWLGIRGCWGGFPYTSKAQEYLEKAGYDQQTGRDVHRMKALNKNGKCKYYKISFIWFIIKQLTFDKNHFIYKLWNGEI